MADNNGEIKEVNDQAESIADNITENLEEEGSALDELVKEEITPPISSEEIVSAVAEDTLGETSVEEISAQVEETANFAEETTTQVEGTATIAEDTATQVEVGFTPLVEEQLLPENPANILGSVPPTFPPDFTPPPEYSVEENTVAKKKNSQLPLYIILAVALIGGLLFFVLRGSSGVKSNPKSALTSAISNSIDNLKSTPTTLPDLEVSFLDPRKVSFELGSVPISGTFTPLPVYLQDFLLKMEVKSHLGEKKIYSSFGFDSSLYSVKTTEFYLTPETLAMRIPNLYNDKDFVNVNLKTFVNDWNKSDYGIENTIPKTLDFSKIVNGLFEFQIQAEKKNAAKKDTDSIYETAGEDFVKSLDVAFVESKDNYHYVTGTITPEKFSEVMKKFADDLENSSFSNAQEFSEMLPVDFFQMLDMGAEDFIDFYMEISQANVAMARSAAIEEPLVIHFKINKDSELLQEVYVPNFSLLYTDQYDYEDSIEANIRIKSGTEGKYLADDIAVSLVPLYEYSDIYGSYGYDSLDDDEEFTGWEDQRTTDDGKKDEIKNEEKSNTPDPFYEEEIENNPLKFTLSRKVLEDKDLLGATWTYTGQANSYSVSQPITATVEHSWNKEETKENNFSGRLSVDDGTSFGNTASFQMSGLLLSPDKETMTFTNGRLSLKQGFAELIGFTFDFHNVPMKAEDIVPDIKTTVDFFKVDWEKYLEEFMNDVIEATDDL